MDMKRITIPALALAALAAAAWFAFRPQGGDDGTADERKGRLVRRAGQGPVDARKKVREIVATETRKVRRRPAAEMFERLKGKDRKLAEAIQDALDNDNYAGVMKSVDAAMRSENAEVRSHLVDALSWFGVEALPELTALMADADEDVAESAQAQWLIALAEIESPGKRMEIGLAVLATLTNRDLLADISGEVSNAALEYIDGESNATRQDEKRVEVVQALLDIMEGARPACAEAAAETYEEITGHEWMGIDEAERYLEAPDDYEPPEDRETEDSPDAGEEPPAEDEGVDAEAEEVVDDAADAAEGEEGAAEGDGDGAAGDAEDAGGGAAEADEAIDVET